MLAARSSSLPYVLAVFGLMLFGYGAMNNAKSDDAQYEIQVQKKLEYRHGQWDELYAELSGNLSAILKYCPPKADRNTFTAYYCPKEWEKRVREEVSVERTTYENRAQGLMLGGGICFLVNLLIIVVVRRRKFS